MWGQSNNFSFASASTFFGQDRVSGSAGVLLIEIEDGLATFVKADPVSFLRGEINFLVTNELKESDPWQYT